MTKVLSGLEPQTVFHYFEEISAIPRGSGNEKAVSDYIAAFGRRKGLPVHQDRANNVLITKPASAGCENAPTVALQGHMDMVCEKNEGTVHDFLRDPIKLQVVNGWVCAEGTTLGADDGIAVAMMLALLSDDSLTHPPLECIFTVCEETGMDGAFAFDGSLLNARYMINLDSEEEGVATVSCCGGLRAHVSKPAVRRAANDGAVELFVGGLAGGHSGMDIAKNRANALKIMGGLLSFLRQQAAFELADIAGGSKDNAIPRECRAVLVTDCPTERIRELTRAFTDGLAPFSADDAAFAVTVTPVNHADGVLEQSDQIIEFLTGAPNGVQSRFAHDPTMVESSCNLASIRLDGGELRANVSIRAAAQERRDAIAAALEQVAQNTGFSVERSNEYPGWDYEPQSHLRDVMRESYRSLFGKELALESIHAGLECGLFKSKCPQLDIIAIGPNNVGCHTPQERMEIASCKTVWELVLDTLKRLC